MKFDLKIVKSPDGFTASLNCPEINTEAQGDGAYPEDALKEAWDAFTMLTFGTLTFEEDEDE